MTRIRVRVGIRLRVRGECRAMTHLGAISGRAHGGGGTRARPRSRARRRTRGPRPRPRPRRRQNQSPTPTRRWSRHSTHRRRRLPDGRRPRRASAPQRSRRWARSSLARPAGGGSLAAAAVPDGVRPCTPYPFGITTSSSCLAPKKLISWSRKSAYCWGLANRRRDRAEIGGRRDQRHLDREVRALRRRRSPRSACFWSPAATGGLNG